MHIHGLCIKIKMFERRQKIRYLKERRFVIMSYILCIIPVINLISQQCWAWLLPISSILIEDVERIRLPFDVITWQLHVPSPGMNPDFIDCAVSCSLNHQLGRSKDARHRGRVSSRSRVIPLDPWFVFFSYSSAVKPRSFHFSLNWSLNHADIRLFLILIQWIWKVKVSSMFLFWWHVKVK